MTSDAVQRLLGHERLVALAWPRREHAPVRTIPDGQRERIRRPLRRRRRLPAQRKATASGRASTTEATSTCPWACPSGSSGQSAPQRALATGGAAKHAAPPDTRTHWKWQVEKGPPWQREKGPPVSVNLSVPDLLSERLFLGCRARLVETVRAAGVKAVSPAKRGRSAATRLDAGEHTVTLCGPTARAAEFRCSPRPSHPADSSSGVSNHQRVCPSSSAVGAWFRFAAASRKLLPEV